MNTMNRWNRPAKAFLLLCTLCLFGQATPPASAQSLGREFPPGVTRGQLTVGMPPEVTLNGRAARLAPGARIRGTNNMLLMSAGLSGKTFPVVFLRDASGALREVWLLSDAEIRDARLGPAQVTSNIVSESDQQRLTEEAGKTRYGEQPKYPKQ
jgi:hypothetical protein